MKIESIERYFCGRERVANLGLVGLESSKSPETGPCDESPITVGAVKDEFGSRYVVFVYSFDNIFALFASVDVY